MDICRRLARTLTTAEVTSKVYFDCFDRGASPGRVVMGLFRQRRARPSRISGLFCTAKKARAVQACRDYEGQRIPTAYPRVHVAGADFTAATGPGGEEYLRTRVCGRQCSRFKTYRAGSTQHGQRRTQHQRNSQFFIHPTVPDAPTSNGCTSYFGRVIEGMDVVKRDRKSRLEVRPDSAGLIKTPKPRE